MASGCRAVKFVESGPSGLPQKRRQAQQACESCRKRKKRCKHAEGQEEDDEGEGPSHANASPERRKSLSTGHTPSEGISGDRETKPAHSRRFVCDTNPEGMFAEATGSDAAESRRFVGDTNPEGMFVEVTGSAAQTRQARNDEVGVWVWLPSKKNADGSTSQAQNSTPAPRPSIPFDPILLPHVRSHCLKCIPPEKELRQLRRIFLRKIEPIYSLIPESVLKNDDSPASIVLHQVICLAAATDPSVAHNLKLNTHGSEKLSFNEFSRALSDAIRTTLATSLIADRTVHIRVLCMLSLYFQPTTSDESEVPSQFFAEAVHHAQTLGLHLLRTGDPALETLFCAMWAIDKIMGAAWGRPRLIFEADFAASLDECVARQEPCFRLWLLVSRWLDRTIDLYRASLSLNPASDFKPYIDLPVLEPLIVEANATEVSRNLIATIEVFYHAVVILSCRLPRPGSKGDWHYSTNVPPAMANARRSLASERIASGVKREKLSPVPFIPYAVSLSLSVEYRKMRHSALPMFRTRARDAFKSNCDLLKRYKDVFYSAKVTLGLGERMLREMERAATTLYKEVPVPDPQLSHDNTSEPTPRTGYTPGTEPPPGYELTPANGFTNFDTMDLNMDVFGAFDPSFDLNLADNALEGNLDIGLPLNWGDWEQFGS